MVLTNVFLVTGSWSDRVRRADRQSVRQTDRQTDRETDINCTTLFPPTQMAVTEDNLFVFGNGSQDVNMPMVNVEVQDRNTHKPIPIPTLSQPADIFVERTGVCCV